MSWPPMLMHVKVRGEDTNFGLWLPLFLLWPIVLAVLIILSPLVLAAVLVLWPGGWGRWSLRVLRDSLRVLCAMRGLRVDVRERRQCVYISVV
ncbi:MAG: hypothetical protein PHR43_05445 [Dehalococcoidales bacterium]|nr:hypothetical protein [Dehalococcoidales bacterium]